MAEHNKDHLAAAAKRLKGAWLRQKKPTNGRLCWWLGYERIGSNADLCDRLLDILFDANFRYVLSRGPHGHRFQLWKGAKLDESVNSTEPTKLDAILACVYAMREGA